MYQIFEIEKKQEKNLTIKFNSIRCSSIFQYSTILKIIRSIVINDSTNTGKLDKRQYYIDRYIHSYAEKLIFRSNFV